MARKQVKRAITLSGGGPAAGMSIGTLERLDAEPDLAFDVWSSSSIGAWTMVAYHSAPQGEGVDHTKSSMKEVFRPDDWYARFPIPTIFTPDWFEIMRNTVAFICDPQSYNDLVVPDQIWDAMEYVARFVTDPTKWTSGDFNHLMLNAVLAPNPVVRFWTSLIYKSGVNGLSSVYHPNNPLLEKLDFDQLYQSNAPEMYHNAYNLSRKRMEIFSNSHERLNRRMNRAYRPITAKSLVAGSALPYIEEPIDMDGETFCEGALLDTINFRQLLEDHPDLDEIWVSRLLDANQIDRPENLYEALNNLIMLFAVTTSENNVNLFKKYLRENNHNVRVVDIPGSSQSTHDWTYSNLEDSIKVGYSLTDFVLARYREKDDNVLDAMISSAA